MAINPKSKSPGPAISAAVFICLMGLVFVLAQPASNKAGSAVAQAEGKRELPLIDQKAPAKTETATFALG